MSAPYESRCRRTFAVCISTLAFCIALTSCAPRALITLPSDPGTPFPDFAAVHARLSSACAGVRTLTAEIGLSGRAGDEPLRGRVVAGFERPSSMHLQGVAPFGQPIFILAARGGSATLLIPRESRIVRDTPEAILEALTGVALDPADLQAVFTGCVLPAPRPLSGVMHTGGWAAIDIETAPEQGTARRTATLFLRRAGAQWQLRAARRDRWQIEYTPGTGLFPQSVRLASTTPDVPVDLRAALSQLETNTEIDPAAFTVDERKDVTPMTIEELRESGPLRGR